MTIVTDKLSFLTLLLHFLGTSRSGPIFPPSTSPEASGYFSTMYTIQLKFEL